MEEMKKVTEYSDSRLKWKVTLVLTVLLMGLGAYYYFSLNEKREDYHYITTPISKGELSLTVSATGYIEPVEKVDVGSEISGTVEKIFVDYNDVVKKGQVLAQLDKTKYQSALRKASASLSSAQASLENMKAQLYQAEATFTRNKNLKKSTQGSLPSQSDWDRDWAAYLTAKAQVASAEARIVQEEQTLISAQYDLTRTTIYSPIDGIILVRNIEPGQTMAASFQTPVLFTIAKDLTKMELQASIDEADIARVKKDQNATFSVDTYADKYFQAKIRLVRVNSEIIEGVVTYKAVMDVDNEALLLKPGMSADVDITTNTLNDTFIVQKAALIYEPVKARVKKMFGRGTETEKHIDTKPHIWILKDNQPQKVYIQIKGSSASLTAIASTDLNKGDQVILMQEIKK